MKNFFLIVFILSTSIGFSQKTIPEVLEQFNKQTVPYITVKELKNKQNVIILDTREEKEYNVSHIKNAYCVGYEKFSNKKIPEIIKTKEATIVVYCSVGVRSEKIGERLKKKGYNNVLNLYGGIFEWKNEGEEVVDNNNVKTEKVHAFSKEWSKYLTKGIKIFEN
jgi:rhodanese-related sulfurtransferase